MAAVSHRLNIAFLQTNPLFNSHVMPLSVKFLDYLYVKKAFVFCSKAGHLLLFDWAQIPY